MPTLQDYTDEQKRVATTKLVQDYGYTQPDEGEVLGALSEIGSASTDKGVDLVDRAKTTEEKIAPPPPVLDPKDKPAAQEKGLSFQEAIEIFGQDFTGVHQNPDGTYTADKSALARLGVKTAGGTPEEQAQSEVDKKSYEDAVARLEGFSAGMETDPALKRILEGISGTWESRIREEERSNASRTAAMTTAGYRYGSLRYGGGAAGPMAGIISAEERAGLDRISDLQSKRDSALAEARSAYENKKWDQYVKMVDIADKKYSESKKAVAELVKVQAEEEKKRKERENQISRDVAISNAFSQGITDPATILEYLRDNGNDSTLEEIDKVLKIINPAESLAGASADYKTFKLLQKQKDPAVDGLNWLEYLDAIQNAKAKPVIKEFVVNGRRVRQVLDQSGAVIDETDLGDAGEAGGSRSETRDSGVSQFLESKKGADGFVDVASYQKGLRDFIAGGGTQANFFASFPQQSYLRQEEIDKLPPAMKPVQTATTKTLLPDQTSILNDAKARLDIAKQRYEDVPSIREAIIQQSIKEYGFDPSPYL